jgi:hypothetical protein
MGTIKAAVFIRPGKIALEERPIPSIGPGEALLKIATTTDLRHRCPQRGGVLKVAITP